jgi:hypothetical protein
MNISKMDYSEKSRGELERIQTRIATLRQKAESISGPAKERYEKERNRLETIYHVIDNKQEGALHGI